MANRTVKDAQSIHGKNPQFLIEKIVRTRIHETIYWKEELFALTAASLVDKAIQLDHVGGVYGGNFKPSKFLSMLLKMLQLAPEKQIAIEYLQNTDFKYLRVLGAFYLRLVGTSQDCYQHLEPLLGDYRKIRFLDKNGAYIITHVDELIDDLLRKERVCDVILPRIQSRYAMELSGELEPREPLVEVDEDEMEEEEERRREEEKRKKEEEEPSGKHRLRLKGDDSSKTSNTANTTAPRDAAQIAAEEIDEANALRAKLGLKPLRP